MRYSEAVRGLPSLRCSSDETPQDCGPRGGLIGRAGSALIVAVVLACLVVCGAAQATHSVPVVTVHVVIHGHPENNPGIPGKAFYTPDDVKAGTLVIFKIKNVDRVGHDFEINDIRSRVMGRDGGLAIIRVFFKKPGNYFGSAIDDEHSGIGGSFIVKP